jgi:hypothetical protein
MNIHEPLAARAGKDLRPLRDRYRFVPRQSAADHHRHGLSPDAILCPNLVKKRSERRIIKGMPT